MVSDHWEKVEKISVLLIYMDQDKSHTLDAKPEPLHLLAKSIYEANPTDVGDFVSFI